MFLTTLLVLLSFFCSFNFYFSDNKRDFLLICVPSVMQLFTLVIIEVSNSNIINSYTIIIFKLLLIISLLLNIWKKKRLIFISYILPFSLSFFHHYGTIYSLILPLVLIYLNLKSDRAVIVSELGAQRILNSLDEGVLISTKDSVILINNKMKDIFGLKTLNLSDISEKIFNNSKEILDLLKYKKTIDLVIFNGRDHYQINSSFNKNSIILTGINVSKEIKLRDELNNNIKELEDLSIRLEELSKERERSGLTKEKEQVYGYIEDLINRGLNNLHSDLLQISNVPPVSYEGILRSSRSLLSEIREIVKNWRLFRGEE
ncbi:hypothetical protein EW093_07480 [Thiospirochaeta perfilievii]|uniref:Uncharacterized protein n=1 Tax=Thiospirochaeta perfilievii TaxID=252967 RepID=A0A5C1QB12_9SPIO|nr:hypothetical protein [Thiospirochaeta perfilievii]QEN04548.1 hypothetical protein EW093_07480 [Thiospirochaeta perfilievii]